MIVSRNLSTAERLVKCNSVNNVGDKNTSEERCVLIKELKFFFCVYHTIAETAASKASLSLIFTYVLVCGASVVAPNVVISSPFKYVTVNVESFLQFHRWYITLCFYPTEHVHITVRTCEMEKWISFKHDIFSYTTIVVISNSNFQSYRVSSGRLNFNSLSRVYNVHVHVVYENKIWKSGNYICITFMEYFKWSRNSNQRMILQAYTKSAWLKVMMHILLCVLLASMQ